MGAAGSGGFGVGSAGGFGGGLRAARVDLPLAELRIPAALLLVGGLVQPLVGDGTVGLPCLLRETTGIPCPFCGMTTSVAATMWLDLRSAVAANPAGVLLVLFAVVLVVGWRRWERVRRARVPAAVLAVLVASMWVFELFRFEVL